MANLFLAGIPLFLSTCLLAADRLRFHWTIKLALFSLWLLFLPNAPYILTDILHLPRAGQAPVWYDLALLLSCAGTGLLLGYLSAIDVHTIVARRYSVVAGWSFALVSLGLSGFAIYLGRFLRWNSWDVITTPSLMFDLPAMLKQARPVSVTLIFGVIFVLGYISLRVLLDPSTARSTDQTS